LKFIEKYKTDLIVGAWEGYRQAILSLLEPDMGATVLDLGSGEGQLTRRMKKRIGAAEIYGTDLSSKVEETSFEGCDLNVEIPYHKHTFDVVIASHIIEHLQDTDRFAEEIGRVMKPSGYAIISTPNLAAWHNVAYLVAGRQPETAAVSDQMYPWVEAPGHRRIFTATELIRFLNFHGFTVEKLVSTTYYPLLEGRLSKWLAKLDWKHACMTTVKIRRK
jgi:2-polyprenyl-3-methyl-5-hydroxy-6-metoxy-1,4-benzoquinol methylase